MPKAAVDIGLAWSKRVRKGREGERRKEDGITDGGGDENRSDVDVEVDEPAVHEDAAEREEHAGNLEVETVLGVGWIVWVEFEGIGVVKVGDAAAEEGAGHEAES